MKSCTQAAYNDFKIVRRPRTMIQTLYAGRVHSLKSCTEDLAYIWLGVACVQCTRESKNTDGVDWPVKKVCVRDGTRAVSFHQGRFTFCRCVNLV